MAIDTQRYRLAIERLYTDRATIYRHMQQKDTFTRETELVRVVVEENIPCRISQRSLASPQRTEEGNLISYEIKLFAPPDVEIRHGDVVMVTRGGKTREYIAGEPFMYDTHQEVLLQRKEWA